MLHINDFKFRLKEKSENLFFNGNHKRTKFNSNLIPFEEILFNKNVSTLVTLGPKSSTPSSIEAISDYTKLFFGSDHQPILSLGNYQARVIELSPFMCAYTLFWTFPTRPKSRG